MGQCVELGQAILLHCSSVQNCTTHLEVVTARCSVMQAEGGDAPLETVTLGYFPDLGHSVHVDL